jgi:predicted dehydrogenase
MPQGVRQRRYSRPVGQLLSVPSDKLTVACIGVGSQGQRVLMDLLRMPEVQVVAVCDVNRQTSDYLDWGPNELRKKVRLLLQEPSWGASFPGPTAGRDVALSIANAFYARKAGKGSYQGCAAYEDFRELLAKEKDLDAVVVSTPDHWHALITIAAMKAGKHVYSQKPMAHTVWEAREMARVAKETGRATQVSIFNAQTSESRRVIDIVHSGVLGAVHRVDLWTTRPPAFWKQGLATPSAADSIPAGLNWDMWLGPAALRPYNHAYLPLYGGPGMTLAVERSGIWESMRLTPLCAPSISVPPTGCMPAQANYFRSATRWPPG